MTEGTSTKKRALVVVAAILLIFVAAYSPQGQKAMTSLSQMLGASATSSSERYEVLVVLEYDNGGSFEWRAFMPKREYKEIDFFEKKISKKYVAEAQKALARKMGYFQQVYGEDSDKLMNTKVNKILVTDLRTDKETRLKLGRR